MIAEIFKEIFGEDAFKALDERFEKLSKGMDEKNCDRSYFHSVSDKYENGEHVSHKEKEVKDGKVIKDVGFGVGIEDKTKNEKYALKSEREKTNQEWEKKKNEERRSYIKDCVKKSEEYVKSNHKWYDDLAKANDFISELMLDRDKKLLWHEEMLKEANETIEKLKKENSEKDEIIENLTKKIKDITTFLQNMNAYMVNNKQIFE